MRIEKKFTPVESLADGHLFPDEVPVLTAQDIIRGNYDNGLPEPYCCRCLRGHAAYVFAGKKQPPLLSDSRALVVRQVEALLTDTAEKMGLHHASRYIPRFNDDRRNSKARLARCWNITMHRLGYDVENAA